MRNIPAAADLLQEQLGPAKQSHPEEYGGVLADLKGSGVDVVMRPGTLAYSPARGNPGRMILDPDASLGALRHEYQHFLDHRDAGFPGFRPYYEDPAAFARLEVRGYQREIQTARATGHDDLVPALIEQMRARVRELMGVP